MIAKINLLLETFFCLIVFLSDFIFVGENNFLFMISLNPVRRMSCFRIDNDDADDGDVLVATALVANGGSVREEGGGAFPRAQLRRFHSELQEELPEQREGSCFAFIYFHVSTAASGGHVRLSGRSGALVRGVGAVCRPQEFTGAGGC